jgi:hypothetical protein
MTSGNRQKKEPITAQTTENFFGFINVTADGVRFAM